MKTCDRCGKETQVSLMSMFNTDVICSACIYEERAHPDFLKARDAEHEAVRGGDYNYPGVGLPADLAAKYRRDS